jgi:hypothetical protein
MDQIWLNCIMDRSEFSDITNTKKRERERKREKKSPGTPVTMKPKIRERAGTPKLGTLCVCSVHTFVLVRAVMLTRIQKATKQPTWTQKWLVSLLLICCCCRLIVDSQID